MPALAASRRVKLSQLELFQLKWLLGVVLTLIAFWALLGLEFGTGPLLWVLTAAVLVVLLRPDLPGRLPEVLWKAGTPALITVIVMDFLLHGSDLIGPMIRMILFLTFFRCLQYRRRREDLQLMLLCLFMLVVAGVLTVSAVFAVQMLCFAPLAMGYLFLVNFLEGFEERPLRAGDWDGFRWSVFLQRIWLGMDYKMISLASVLFLAVVGVSSLIFVLIPRFNFDRTVPFLQIQATGQIGFSDRISFGDINRLVSDRRIAMRVEVPDLADVPSIPYWRMIVLDQYFRGTFEVSDSLRRSRFHINEESHEYTFPGRNMSGRRVEGDPWVFFLEGDISRYVPLPGMARSIHFARRLKFTPYPDLNLLRMDSVNSSLLGYRLTGLHLSDRIPASASERNQLDALRGTPLFMDSIMYEMGDMPRYPETTLILPADRDSREFLSAALHLITGGRELTTEEFSNELIAWLQENYQYDHQTGLQRRYSENPLIDWMRNSRTGWCEHFAGAFTLLARKHGVPTRVVAGFTGASWNDYENYLVVRNSHAHAWVEVYNEVGEWVRFDPTPALDRDGLSASDGFDALAAAESGLQAWLDGMRMLWYRRIIDFDRGDQAELAATVRNYSTGMLEEFKASLQTYWQGIRDWFLRGWDRDKVLHFFLILAGLSTGFLTLRIVWLRGWDRILRARVHRYGVGGSDRIRNRASRWLRVFKPAYRELRMRRGDRAGELWHQTYTELLALRFDSPESRPSPRPVFRRARRLLRERRRAQRQAARR